MIFAKNLSGAFHSHEVALLCQEQERKMEVYRNLVIRQEPLKLEGDGVKATGISQHMLTENSLDRKG